MLPVTVPQHGGLQEPGDADPDGVIDEPSAKQFPPTPMAPSSIPQTFTPALPDQPRNFPQVQVYSQLLLSAYEACGSGEPG